MNAPPAKMTFNATSPVSSVASCASSARMQWGIGLFLALLAFNCAFMSQHHFALACQFEIEERQDDERIRIIIGNRWYKMSILMSLGSAAFVALAS